MRVLCLALLAAATLPFASPAFANDSVATLETGGIVPVQTDAIAMEREVLTISPEVITVDYVFRNLTDQDVTTMVAFPMPDLPFYAQYDTAIPVEADNFLGFTVTQDGQPITPVLHTTVLTEGGRDITDLLREVGLPLTPFADFRGPIDALSEDMRTRLIDQAVLWGGDRPEPADWTLRSAYYWEATFPANSTVAVSHRYRTSMGAHVAVSFLPDADGTRSPTAGDYRTRYCTEDNFIAGVARRHNSGQYMYEGYISYVLGTGGNWAGGRIGDFTLIVDKGRPDALVSFCGEGVEKIGPTTFRMHKTNYAPPPMLDILLALPAPG